MPSHFGVSVTSSSKRSIEVDLFRGLALVVITLDHIPRSLLSHVTLHNYAFCDAAEVFVFVGGYSVAAAYTAISARAGDAAARGRFLKRGWEIYRAFLVTAAIMLTLGMLFHGLKLDTPAVDATEAGTFLRRPFGELFDIVSLRRQPFLSSVLPMYAMFAFSAPFIVRAARRMPWLVLASSVGIWYFAPALAEHLPSAYPEGWAFNPFAWQLLFVVGAVSRLHPVSPALLDSDQGRKLTWLALAAVMVFAFWQVFLTFSPSPGYEKQNLAVIRLLNFGALAWLATWATHRGWIARVADRVPAIVCIGQQSLPCFVAGAAISVTMDALSRPILALVQSITSSITSSATIWIDTSVATGLGSAVIDTCAVTLLLLVAHTAATLAKRGAGTRTTAPRTHPDTHSLNQTARMPAGVTPLHVTPTDQKDNKRR